MLGLPSVSRHAVRPVAEAAQSRPLASHWSPVRTPATISMAPAIRPRGRQTRQVGSHRDILGGTNGVKTARPHNPSSVCTLCVMSREGRSSMYRRYCYRDPDFTATVKAATQAGADITRSVSHAIARRDWRGVGPSAGVGVAYVATVALLDWLLAPQTCVAVPTNCRC